MKTVVLKCRILLLSGLFALLGWSCETQELITYEGGTAFISFYSVGTQRINIAAIDPDAPYRDFSVRVRVIGDIVNYDRPIPARLTTTFARRPVYVYDYDEEGEPIIIITDHRWVEVPDRDFEILPSYIRAGSALDVLRVRVHNRGKIKAYLNRTDVILDPNEHFRVDFAFLDGAEEEDRRVFRLYAENTLGMPNLWAAQYSAFEGVFGRFSIRKYELIRDVIGLGIGFFVYNPEVETSQQALERIGDRHTLTAWARAVQVRLNEYQEENGREMLDERGEPIRLARDWAG